MTTSSDNAGLVSEFKKARERLRRAIVRSKDEKWKEFRAALEQDPWGRPYGVVKAKIIRCGAPESFSRGRVARILENLFVTGREEQSEEGHGIRIPWTQDEDPYDLRVTEEYLRVAMKRCDPKKATGVDGVPGQVVKIIVEQRPRRLLDLFNSIYRSGMIPVVWKC